MRYYLRVDNLQPFVDTSGTVPACLRITPIFDSKSDLVHCYSSEFKDRIEWMKACCSSFAVHSCQLCNGWTVYNTFVFEFHNDADALLFKLRWLG